MAVREFTDSAGTEWRVWDTIPNEGRLLRTEFRNGWLTFESAIGRYRLAPVLRDWQNFSVEKLEALCRTARAEDQRSSPARDADRRDRP